MTSNSDNPSSSTSAVERAIEEWLTSHLTVHRDRGVDAPGVLEQYTPVELLALVQRVLARSPRLAASARRLALFDQFRLTFELVRGSSPALPHPAAVRSAIGVAHQPPACFAPRRSRRPR